MNPEEEEITQPEPEPEGLTEYETSILESLGEEKELLEQIFEKLPDPPDPPDPEAEYVPTPEEELLNEILEKLPEPPDPNAPIEPEGLSEFEQTVLDRLANLEGVQTDYFGFIHDYGWLALGVIIGLIGFNAFFKKLLDW